MRPYSDTITLVKNRRGVWDLDTSKGCSNGVADNPKGCYNDCYAANAACRRGFDFSKTVLRHFENKKHECRIVRKINKIDMPFVRMGVTGDPSENWDHTLDVCRRISVDTQLGLFPEFKKTMIVIVTKHWNNLTKQQLNILPDLNICVNTSVSALDKPALLSNRLIQYNRLKKYCKSILRVVSCSFNLKSKIGIKLNQIQQDLFNNEYVLDTILRVGNENEYVLNGIINIEKEIFLGKLCCVSRSDKNTYFGECSKCPEMCGLIN